MFRQFTDTGTEFLLGDSVNSLTPDCSIDSKRFLTALEIAMSGTHGRHLLGKMVSLMPRDRKYHKACQFIHEVIDQQIENAFRSLKSTEIGGTGEHRLVLLHELVKQTTDKALIRGNILTVYAAGTESQATVISHVLFLLSRNPGVLLTLLDEIMTIGMKQPTLQEIKGLPFLKAVILEGTLVVEGMRVCSSRTKIVLQRYVFILSHHSPTGPRCKILFFLLVVDRMVTAHCSSRRGPPT